MGKQSRFPLVALVIVLVLAGLSYGWFLPQMGGNSDDLAFAQSVKRLGVVDNYIWYTHHHHPRLFQAALLNALFAGLAGMWPLIHAASILLLALGIVLLMSLVWNWTKSRLATIVAGAVFALHPGPNDAVLWPMMIGHLAMAVLVIASIWFMQSYFRSRRKRDYLFAAVSFSLACLCLEQAFVFFPVMAATAFFYPRPKKKAWVAMAIFFGITILSFAVESLVHKDIRGKYEIDLLTNMPERIATVLQSATEIMTSGHGGYQPGSLLANGLATTTSSLWAFLLLGALFLAGTAWLTRCFFSEDRQQNQSPVDHLFLLLLIGLYIYLAGVLFFALRPDARLFNRHLVAPLVGVSLFTAGTFLLIVRKTQTMANGQWAGLARLISACCFFLFIVAAALINVGEGAQYANSRRYQEQVTNAISDCLSDSATADYQLHVENLRSHFGRVRTFADDWSLPNLLKLEYPEQFKTWGGKGSVTFGIETLSESEQRKTIALSYQSNRMLTYNAIEYFEQDKLVRRVPLPLAELSACRKKSLRVNIGKASPLALFGDELALLQVETLGREDGTVSTMLLYLRTPQDARQNRYPLTIQVVWRLAGEEIYQHEIELTTPLAAGGTLGRQHNYRLGQIPAAASLSLAVEDSQGAVLTPRSPKPIELRGNSLLVGFAE